MSGLMVEYDANQNVCARWLWMWMTFHNHLVVRESGYYGTGLARPGWILEIGLVRFAWFWDKSKSFKLPRNKLCMDIHLEF